MSQGALSTVRAVRLHRTGAVVTRRVRIAAAAGLSEQRFGGLPLALDDSTLRAAVLTGGELTQVSVEVSLVGRSGSESVDEPRLWQLRSEEDALRADLGMTARKQEELGKLALAARPAARDAPRPAAAVEPRQAWLTLRTTLLERLFADRARLERELQHKTEERAALEAELEKGRGARAPDAMSLRKVAVARLDCPVAGEIEVEISYFVPGARWAPAYVLRLVEGSRHARLELRASVCQSTGEDWSNVELSLSTADVARQQELPELTSLRVGRAQPPPKRRPLRPADVDPKELFRDYARGFRPTPIDEVTPVPERASEAEEALERVTVVAPPQAGFAPMQVAASAPPGFGPPPAPEAPAAFRQQPMAMPAAPRSASLFSAFAGGAPKARTGKAPSPMDASGPAAASRLELDPRWLDLSSLRMPAPEAMAGKLTLASEVDRYVGVAQAGQARAWMAVAEAWERACRRALSTQPPERHVLPAPESGFFHVLEGQFRVDVPSDGSFHSIPVLQSEASLALKHVCVPRESADVFRLAELDNPLDAPLLAGPCDVYVGPELLITTSIETVPIGGRLSVGLGVEQRVKVARNTHFAEGSQGLMGGTLTLKHRIDIEVVSHLSSQAELEVRERVPSVQEKEEDIKVDVIAVTPPWRVWEPPAPEPAVRGAFAWRVELAPQARAELSVEYLVRLPSKLELVGGNRRD